MGSAFELGQTGGAPPLPGYMQNYVLVVSTEKVRLWECWGWGPIMLKRLRSLRDILDGDAREQMDLLIGRVLRELESEREKTAPGGRRQSNKAARTTTS